MAGELNNIFQRRGILNGKGVSKVGKQIYPTSNIPTNCPYCNGDRNWDIYLKVAICHSCGKREDVRPLK